VINRTLPLLLALGLTACASDPAPTEQLRLTEQALVQTRSLGVVSEQSESLRQAETKFAQAQTAMQDGENKQARQLAEQAELDARLAEAQHFNAKSREQLTELNQRIGRLRQQLGAM
jgi:outer membrane PBP1 activator LpoA protein